eukprot:4946705-Heterocapsa_arctica.AAC.1
MPWCWARRWAAAENERGVENVQPFTWGVASHRVCHRCVAEGRGGPNICGCAVRAGDAPASP